MSAPNIELYVEELVLHGFAQGDRHHIADAFERELARLLAEQLREQVLPSSWASSAEREGFDAGAVHVASGSKPDAIGTQIAQAVHGGLRR